MMGETFYVAKEKREVLKKILTGVCALALAALAAGCSQNNETVNANVANANAVAANTAATGTGENGNATAETRSGPDDTEIRTETADGVTTETRTFKDPNSRVEKVVVTTRDGKRTARVYYRDKTARELPEGDVGRALDATGDALASAGGKVVDVSKDVGSTVADKTGDAAHAVGDKAGDVKDATVQGAKTAGRATANAADEAGEKTASGAKKAAKATAKGAKKVGGAIKNAITP